MNNWIDYFYSFILGAAMLLSAMGLWFVAIMPSTDAWSKKFFRCYFLVLLIGCSSTLFEFYIQYHQVPVAANYLFVILECLFLSMPLPMITLYLLHCCGENPHESRLFRIVLGLWAVYVAMLLSAPFIGGFSTITADGQYKNGPLYPLLLVPLVLSMLANFAGTIKRKDRLSHKEYLSFLVAIFPMTVAIILLMFADAYPIFDISFVISALSMYGLIQSNQIEQDMRHQQEIANQRTSIMVLQMRPHFIYNTMTSIYCLCNQDPQLARQVTKDFTTYLRKNFTAIASEEPIPFSSELEHTKAYLSVEQAQYKDSLSVDYDTPHTLFKLPPLTLQPIVENAVKHGRDMYSGPLHISVRTRKTDSGSEIIVEDNGRGYTAADENEPHIALNNIRQRLKVMCCGSLDIRSGDECGTVVTVTIPGSASD